MKHFHINHVVKKIRRGLAGAFACVVVLGVPLLSLMQLGHFHGFGHDRPATPLPAFHTRAIDATAAKPALFKQPLISVTMDDGYETTYTEAMPIMQKYGIHTTQYLLSGVEDQKLYLSWDQIKAMQNAGHEIACHTINHPDLRTLSSLDVKNQVKGCKDTMSRRYGPITDFASPYGSADNRTLAIIKKYFATQRNTNGDPTNGVTDADVNTAANFDPIRIIGVTVRRDTTAAQIQALVNYTIQHNGWLVLTYHQADDGPSDYGLDPKKLDKQMAILEKAPVRIVTVHQAIASWKKD